MAERSSSQFSRDPAGSRAPKLLALDVDGTLLQRDGTVHPDDAAAIARLAATGIPITIATGRLYSGTRAVARSVGLRGPIACVDGSHIVDLDGDEELFHAAIAGADAELLRDVVRRHAPASFLFAHDRIVHDAEGEAFAPYVQTWSQEVAVVRRVIDHPYWEHAHGLMAVVGIGTEAHIRAAVAELEERLADAARVLSFPVHRIGMFAMLVRAKGPTKGTAVEWLAERAGVAMADVVVVGDWLNDVPMFEVAGRSFVMGQAPPSVKAAATDQLAADCFVGGGIAEAVRRAFDV